MSIHPDAGALARAPATLVDVLLARAALLPEQQAYAFLSRELDEQATWTYAELLGVARRIGRGLSRRARSGDRVLLVFQPGLAFVGSYFACLLAGLVPVPTHPPRARKAGELTAIARDSGARLALTQEELRGRLEVALEGALAIESYDRVQADDDDFAFAPVQPEQIALLQYTSGSTGCPKGVMVSHNNLLANSRVIARAFAHDGDSRGLIWLPAYHDMGLIGGVIQPLFAGFPVWLMSPFDFLQRPARWLQAVSRYRATTSGGPNFAYQLCLERVRDQELDGVDLRSWRIAFTGAEPVRSETVHAFAARYGKHGFDPAASTPCYGLAEATLMVSCAARGDARVGDGGRVAAGVVADGHEVLVVDERGERCPEGEVGEIYVAGPSLATGYWKKPEATRESGDTPNKATLPVPRQHSAASAIEPEARRG
jgi:acyl-CoA synthetase (AMP-forming)/AMP-acid ligase II